MSLASAAPSSRLIKRNHQGFNLFDCAGSSVALACSLGELDPLALSPVTLKDYLSRHLAFRARTLEALLGQVRRAPLLLHLLQGEAGRKSRQLEVARLHVDQVLKVQPRDPDALMAAAMVALDSGKISECRTHLAELEVAAPGHRYTLALRSVMRILQLPVADSDAIAPDAEAGSLLVMGAFSLEQLAPLVKEYGADRILLLPLRDVPSVWPEYCAVSAECLESLLLPRLQSLPLLEVVLPSTGWFHAEYLNLVERALSLSQRLGVVYPDGHLTHHEGEDVHRLRYNASYIKSMARFAPEVTDWRVLDVGCSDGLVTSLMASAGAREAVGIDLLSDTGLRFPHPQVRYLRMDAMRLGFEDNSFDLTFSIATFEHIPEPRQALLEMLRVTRPGGLCYIQAGPLYHSPFGHHMFGYFDALPWAHLRRSKADLETYAKQEGMDERILRDHGQSTAQYLDAMLNTAHINGLYYADYGLEEFVSRPEVEPLFLRQSTEGKDLLTDTIRKELEAYSEGDLIAHGFELMFRVR